jgi:RecA-family ATPase
VFSRPKDMDSKIDVSKYHPFALRTVGFKERLQFIEHYIKEKIKEPSLVILDGVADLCSDVNNIEQSNELVSALMRISTQQNVHIICVIHQNYGSQKLGTGHLGSALEKKAETVISLEANTVNKDYTTVKCGRSRGYSFETFSFQVNEKGLPIIVGDLYDPLK